MSKSSPRKIADQSPSPDDLSFEQAMEELEAIIDRIEQGQIGLEESLAQRKRGDALVKRCRAILDRAEQELQQVKPE
ncbi:MAG TPA: exodeoxyribonuclease VII small subunit [Phycisphaerales bacterium]|nr:exodeoxyribonuclease VII small subunit [Phycisphaerales bacterium]HRQ75462.1 exodeoxyribonuclease VII small subunit [Phycisphaerales bacterium]